MGDFNLHINNAEDADATQFLDLFDALGLSKLIDVPTQRYGNTLYLVIMISIDGPWILNIRQGPYLSDHCVIESVVEINKPKVNYHMVQFRNFKPVVLQKWFKICIWVCFVCSISQDCA